MDNLQNPKFVRPPFFTASRSGPCCPDCRRVDQPCVQIHQAILTQPQPGQDGLESAIIAPLSEAIVDRLPRTIALGQITPFVP